MKKTLKCFLHYSTRDWTGPDDKFTIYPGDMSNITACGLVLVKQLDVAVDVPDDFDPRPEQIKALRKEQAQAAADFHKLCTDIQRQISELDALEFTAEVAA